MRIHLIPSLNLDDFSCCRLNEDDAHKIGLPEGGKIRIFDNNRRMKLYFEFEMKIDHEIPEGQIYAPKLFKSLPISLENGVIVENAAKFLAPSEKYKKIDVDEPSLKSQSQIFAEILRAKTPKKKTENELYIIPVPSRSSSKDEKNSQDSKDTIPEIDGQIGDAKVVNITQRKDETIIDDRSERETIGEYEEDQLASDTEGKGQNTLDNENIADFPDEVSINQLLQTNPQSIIANCIISQENLEGYVVINSSLADKLNLFPGAFIGWEDPKTRGEGMSPILIQDIPDNSIMIDLETSNDSNIATIPNPQIVIYSMEPPLIQVKELTAKPLIAYELVGSIKLNYRNGLSLGFQEGDIATISSAKSKQTVYARVLLTHDLSDELFLVDPNLINSIHQNEELYLIERRAKQVVPIEIFRVKTQISPDYEGSYANLISLIKKREDSVRIHFINYLIYPGLRIKHPDFDAEFIYKSCRPALGPQEIGKTNSNSKLEISFQGIEPFNSIFLFDLTRTMSNRDIFIDKEYKEIKKVNLFLEQFSLESPFTKFKVETYVERSLSALFFFLLYLIEKLSRKLDEQISFMSIAQDIQIIKAENDNPWLDIAQIKSSLLKTYIDAILQVFGEYSGSQMDRDLLISKISKEISILKNSGKNHPIDILLFTDRNPSFYAGLEAELKEIYENQEIRIQQFNYSNLKVDSQKLEKPSSRISIIPLDKFQEMIPFYRKAANFFEE